MGRRIAFFATKQDVLDLLLSLEKRSPLFYVRWGCYSSRRDVPRYETAADIPDLGTAEHGRKGDNRYLVLPSKSTLTVGRSIHVDYGAEYTPQSRGYSPYVFFHSGGIYRDECIITGEVETNFDTPEALAFFNRFKRVFGTRFTRVQHPWCSSIGPQALGLLRAGMRCTADYTSAPEYDFKLPTGLRVAEPGAAPDPAGM